MPTVITIAEPIYQGEGKWFEFTLKDKDGKIIPGLETATFRFQIGKSEEDPAPFFTAEDWDVSQAADGVVEANLPASKTISMEPGTYFGQLMTVRTIDSDVDISASVKFKIKKALVKSA